MESLLRSISQDLVNLRMITIIDYIVIEAKLFYKAIVIKENSKKKFTWLLFPPFSWGNLNKKFKNLYFVLITFMSYVFWHSLPSCFLWYEFIKNQIFPEDAIPLTYNTKKYWNDILEILFLPLPRIRSMLYWYVTQPHWR